MPQSILWAVIVDRDTDVEPLYEFLDSWQSFGCGITGDNHANTGSLAVFEFALDVIVFVFGKIDGPGSVKLDARRGIVRQRGLFLPWIHWKMIFDVLSVQSEHIELLHDADHLRAAEITKSVAGQAQSNRQ